jgi:group I intron endonuclease
MWWRLKNGCNWLFDRCVLMQAYLIQNKLNGKGYIGITTRSIDRRWYEHRFVQNSCGKLLAKAIQKYGEDSFEIKVLASAVEGIDGLKELEKQLIAQHNTIVPSGYNLTAGGDGVFGWGDGRIVVVGWAKPVPALFLVR